MTLLSIDPGTKATGLAVWLGDHPVAWTCLVSKERETYIRLANIFLVLERFADAHGVTEVAVEKPPPSHERPAPELQSMYRDLRKLARRKKWGFHPYHPSTVAASVRLQGMRFDDPKELLRVGVLSLYGMWLPAGLPQDTLDAVAVGHCHIVKQREKAILERGRLEGR